MPFLPPPPSLAKKYASALDMPLVAADAYSPVDLSGGDAGAHGLEIAAAGGGRLGELHHLADHRRHGDEQGGAVAACQQSRPRIDA